MKKTIFLCIFIFLIYMIGYQDVIIQKYTLKSSKLKSNVKLGVISDLHGTKYGKHQEKLLKMINEQAPDVLLFVGDIIDERWDMSAIEELLKGVKPYECFYVMGNHEVATNKEEIKELMKRYGVHMISSSQQILNIQNNKISISGIDDYTSYDSIDKFSCDFDRLSQQVDPSIYSIML